MKKILMFMVLAFGTLLSMASIAASAGIIPPDALLHAGGVSTAAALTVTQLKADFGVYVSNNKKPIFKLLVQPTETQKYMTTIARTVTEYRASKAVIGDVVQGFTTTFNDKGAAEFTPITITNRRHKINVTLVPDEIYDSWIGFMADNDKKPLEYPIVKYVLEELVLPKVNENRELKLIGKGEYDADNLDVTGKSMDGFITILSKAKTAGTSNINFINLNPITQSNAVVQIENFVDEIEDLYQSTSMYGFCDPAVYKFYKRGKRDAHGTHVDYKEGDVIDFSSVTLKPLPSMIGTGALFATPKNNFIRLINRSDGAANVWMQEFDYSVKIFADWWEAVGFGIEEAVFAYIPDTESASGSGSGV